MNVFGIGLPELAVIAAIGLLVFGPKRLPELGKTLGRTLRGFQSASSEFEKEFRSAMAPVAESMAAPEAPAIPESSSAAEPAAAMVVGGQPPSAADAAAPAPASEVTAPEPSAQVPGSPS